MPASGLEEHSDSEEDDEEEQFEFDYRENCRSWSIPDFFEVLKGQLRKLNYVPLTSSRVDCIWGPTHQVAPASVVDQAREVWRTSGWPKGAAFDKAATLARLRQLNVDE
jgi:hypothetical protein